MGIAFTFGFGKFVSHSGKLTREANKKAIRALLKTAAAIVREARQSMARPKRGKMYPRAKRRSSAETGGVIPGTGEPPAAQHGGAGLQGRISYERVDSRTVRVGTDLDYGKYLEFGTENIIARPWLRPAVAKKIKTFEKEMKGFR